MFRIAKYITIITFTVLSLFIYSGCVDSEADGPSIVGHDQRLENALSRRATPVYKRPTPSASSSSRSFPSSWYPNKSVEKKWKAIVIHHSAVGSGSMRTIDSAHKDRGWDGVGYDFVIGNGKGSRSGQIEVTYRWRNQTVGAHCKATNNWANIDGIGICLIGDFTKTTPTNGQMQSLTELVVFLQRRYNISDSRIYGHDKTPNHTTGTLCPGHKFPWSTFRKKVAVQKRKITALAAKPVRFNNL